MPAKNFEDRLSRLEKVAEKLREGGVGLEDAITLFEEGMKLAKSLEKDLSRVERRVEILTSEPPEDGSPPALSLFPEMSEDEKE
jgi:exodeoxyribonuclease VII small subunit